MSYATILQLKYHLGDRDGNYTTYGNLFGTDGTEDTRAQEVLDRATARVDFYINKARAPSLATDLLKTWWTLCLSAYEAFGRCEYPTPQNVINNFDGAMAELQSLSDDKIIYSVARDALDDEDDDDLDDMIGD